MMPTSHLRVYQRLDSFPEPERRRLSAYLESGQRPPQSFPYRHLVLRTGVGVGVLAPAVAEHAFVQKAGGAWYLCPWRMHLRVLTNLLDVKNAFPGEVADALVLPQEAAWATQELARVRREMPHIHPHIQTSPWFVPLRWFLLFDDSERIFIDDDLKPQLRYETDLGSARARLGRAQQILTSARMAPEILELVAALADWASPFPSDSLVELDYGGVCSLIDPEELAADRSAGEVWSCLEALELGDLEEGSERYSALEAFWAGVRSAENLN